MSIERGVRLKFLKINYLPNLTYYTGDDPKGEFRKKLIGFFMDNLNTQYKYEYCRKFYQISALKVEDDIIFGKLWKLKRKIIKDFPWKDNDYQEVRNLGKDYQYDFFLINLKTNHLILETKESFTSDAAKLVLERWFDYHYKIREAISFQYVKKKFEFLEQLKKAKKLTYMKFILYPSNFDFDSLSRPIDESLRKYKISRQIRENYSNEGMIIDLDKPNEISSSIAQTLRGNGEDPLIHSEDERGNKEIISSKIKEVMRVINFNKDLNKVKDVMKTQLQNVLKELDNEKDN